MLKRIISILFFLFFPLLTFACFNPTDSFAVEVWLNKPGINFDLSFLEKAGEDQVIKKDRVLIYRSHFNPEVAVILEKIDEKQLSVKIQIPTKSIEAQTGFDLVPAVNIDPNKFNFKEALKSELIWLIENKVINGLSDEDLNLIYEVANRGNAGHNSKIVWDQNPQTKKYTWLPYNKTGAPLLLKGRDCGGFSISLLPKEKISISFEEKICEDLCGDGICQEIVCMAQGCPCPETPDTCPQDCKKEFSQNLPVPPLSSIRKIEINPIAEKPILIEDKRLEPKEMPKISIEVQTPGMRETTVRIEIDKEKKIINIEHENVVAQTAHPIKIEEKILKIETPKGEISVNVLPSIATKVVIQKEPQKIEKISLEIKNGEPVYQANGVKSEKFLGIIPVHIPVQTEISAKSGKIMKIQKSILMKILDFFSF